jgi:hypothetical protein
LIEENTPLLRVMSPSTTSSLDSSRLLFALHFFDNIALRSGVVENDQFSNIGFAERFSARAFCKLD